MKNFTGVDSPYEAPESPDIRVDTVTYTREGTSEGVLETLARMGIIEAR